MRERLTWINSFSGACQMPYQEAMVRKGSWAMILGFGAVQLLSQLLNSAVHGNSVDICN